MSEITDVEILDGDRTFDEPCVILDAEFARKALVSGELPLFVHQALKAIELSGQKVAFLRESA